MTNARKLACILIKAGYVKKDGSVNLYAAQVAGIADSSTLTRVLSGERVPGLGWWESVLERMGYTVEFVPKRNRS